MEVVIQNLRVLLVDDDEEEYILTQELLSQRSDSARLTGGIQFKLDWVSSFEEALLTLQEEKYDVYLIDYRLGDHDGLELLHYAQKQGIRAPFILMTGQGSYALDMEAMHAGATDYLSKNELTGAILERTIRYAIDRKRNEEEIRAHANRAELLANLFKSFAEARLSYPSILDTIAQEISSATGDACVIRLISEDGNWLEPVSVRHPEPARVELIQAKLSQFQVKAGEGLVGVVYESGQAVLLSLDKDLSAQGSAVISNPNLISHWEEVEDLRGIIIAPLHAHGKRIGTLGILRFRPLPDYSQADQLFYEELAAQAGLAIDNARLFASEMQRVHELNSLNSATQALMTTLDLETLLSQILDAAQSAIPAASNGFIYLITPETGKLQLRAFTNTSDTRIQKIRSSASHGYPQRAAREKRPLLIRDTRDHARHDPADTSVDWSEARSAIFAPLILENVVQGVLSLTASRPAAFSEADLRLLTSFAATTTAALHNAILHSELQKLAITDSLTEFYNRRGLFELGRHELERAHRFGRSLSVIMMDIDRLKEVNDSYGHVAGDQVLRILAGRFRASVREVDIVARYGGDEFVFLLPETDLFTACVVAERLRSRAAEPISINTALLNSQGTPFTGADFIRTTASLGVSHVLPDTPDLNALIERADAAAYQAKRNGRNRIELG